MTSAILQVTGCKPTKRQGLAPFGNSPPATGAIQEVVQTDSLHQPQQVCIQCCLTYCCITIIHGCCSLCNCLRIDHLQGTGRLPDLIDFDGLFESLFGAWHRLIRLGSITTQHSDLGEKLGQPIALRLIQKISLVVT